MKESEMTVSVTRADHARLVIPTCDRVIPINPESKMRHRAILRLRLMTRRHVLLKHKREKKLTREYQAEKSSCETDVAATEHRQGRQVDSRRLGKCFSKSSLQQRVYVHVIRLGRESMHHIQGVPDEYSATFNHQFNESMATLAMTKCPRAPILR